MVATSDCIKAKIITAKKVSKPLMEKKRRARINKCLDQLKYLLENYYTNNIRKRKLEKADILELTVRHLRNLQKIQNGSSSSSEISDYQAGFRNCLAGVNQYMLMADNSKGSSRLSVLAHLSSNLLCTEEQALNSSTVDSDYSAPAKIKHHW
ncbi:hairy-related 3 [Hypomesus transpacificus]|uniref:hairy-related 3 n=1 Tax=Hypomesus transpacificus TaxID=137520 RepID=UPI001F07A633|nr:hairy-related 3 [Hypomesus transpacificus]